MKQNLPPAVDKFLLEVVQHENACQQAKQRALARLASPFHLWGEKKAARESLHARQDIR
jgi:hypothetical protein